MSLVDEVIVIGHGPSPTDRGWGERIDRADCVVRMFDCGWQKPADYGVRYDVGVLTMRKRQAQWFGREATLRPTEWWAYDQDGHGYTVETEEPQTLLSVPEALSEARRLGGMGTAGFLTLTRGTAAACFAASQWRPERLVLVGFDEVRAGTFMAMAYPNDFHRQLMARPDAGLLRRRLAARRPGGHRSTGHDYAVEAAVILGACERVGAKMIWAEDCFE